jgi:hypothetical protein
MFKLVKMVKNNQSLSQIIDVFAMNPATLRLTKTMIGTFYLVHLMACLWFGIANFGGFQENCWVVQNDLHESSYGNQYLVSVYWTF